MAKPPCDIRSLAQAHTEDAITTLGAITNQADGPFFHGNRLAARRGRATRRTKVALHLRLSHDARYSGGGGRCCGR